MISDKHNIALGDLVRVKPTWSIDYLKQANTDLDGKVGVVTSVTLSYAPYSGEVDPLNSTYEVMIDGNPITFYGIRFLEKVYNNSSK
jgi:hypothetical protein